MIPNVPLDALRRKAQNTDFHIFEVEDIIILQKAGMVGEDTCNSFMDTPIGRAKALAWMELFLSDDEES